MKLIPLSAWAASKYDPPPSARTLRRWAVSGNIFPRPQKNGRAYWVKEHAKFIWPQDPNYLEEIEAALNEQASQ